MKASASETPRTSSAILTLGDNQNAPYKLQPPEFRRRGFRHNLIERLGEIAIYRQRKSGLPDAFEVVRIQKREAFSLFDKDYPATETYPRDEAWGVDGFTYRSLDEAERKFAELIGKSKEIE